MQYLFSKPFILRIHWLSFSALALCCSVMLSAQAASNDVDEEGRLIAAPDETDLVERGYLFYPQRVLPKNPKDKRRQTTGVVNPQTAAKAPVPDLMAAAQPEHDEHAASPTPSSSGKSEDSHQPPVVVKSTDARSPSSDKPVAGTVIVQPLERVKTVKLPDHGADPHASDKNSHNEKASAHNEEIPPVLSKAEQAKLERAKAAQARAEKLKEEQAKAELARAERLKEAQAKAELAKAERAKAAQARAEKLKEEQAKAELMRAERAKVLAQAKALKAQEELAKAEKALEELTKADKAKKETPKEELAIEAAAKDEHAKSETAKKTDAVKADPVKDEHEHAKPEPSKAEAAKTAEAANDANAADAHAKSEPTTSEASKTAHSADDGHAADAHAKSEPAKHDNLKTAEPAKPAHAAPVHSSMAARQKLLLQNQESRLLTAAD